MSDRATVLAVDDTPDNLALLSSLLKDTFRVKVATNGQKALRIATSESPPDLILLDVMMPEMDGYEVCRCLKADERSRDIPVIFLTARNQIEDEEQGLGMGAVDYISKPISPPILVARVRTHLRLKEANEFLRDQNRRLEQAVAERTRQLAVVQDIAMVAMGSLAETRDNETGNHIRRTQNYVRALAERLAEDPRYADLLTPETITLLYKSAPLHDIGKVGVPDKILLKPDRLDADEFAIMKQHAKLGRDAIATAETIMEEPETFLHFAREIAYSHHEKWDGSGYPEGLAGTDIPISARLMAVADVYDALISKRCYKPAFSHDKAVALMTEGRGTHFDPEILDAFLAMATAFREIAGRFRDLE